MASIRLPVPQILQNPELPNGCEITSCCEVLHYLGFAPDKCELADYYLPCSAQWYGADPDEDMIRLFKETGAVQVCTISPAIPGAYFPTEVTHMSEMGKFNSNIVMEGMIACAKKALANGITVGLGTDTACPFVTHYDMWRELHYFVKYCGVTPAFALYSATKLNARLAGIGDLTGSIEADKQADLIVCTNDPLRNLSALRELDMVVKGGYRIDKPQIKKMDEVERELDKFL